MRPGGEHKTKLNYSTYQTKFDAKMTKMKRNYMSNINMKYQEQFVNFPGKQGLAIKSKQRIDLFDIISCQLPTINLFIFFDDLQLQIIASISPKASVENSSAQWAICIFPGITWLSFSPCIDDDDDDDDDDVICSCQLSS